MIETILSTVVVVTSVTFFYALPPPIPVNSVDVSTLTVVISLPSSLLEAIPDLAVAVFSGRGASIITGMISVVITVSTEVMTS
jgi:hypothetical protein